MFPPSSEIRAAFASELKTLLQPFFKVCGEALTVTDPPFQQDVWRESCFFLALHKKDANPQSLVSPKLLEAAMGKANETGASRVIVRAPRKQGLLLGVLSQRR